MARPSDELLTELTADVVSAYVSNNPVQAGDLPALISNVHSALKGTESEPEPEPQEKQKPAVSIKKSVHDDYIVCLEDGKQFKSLKRHLKSKFDMTPDEYRQKWGLPADYPMVAPNYSRRRSELAKTNRLGQKRS